jgi:hypothetical protein
MIKRALSRLDSYRYQRTDFSRVAHQRCSNARLGDRSHLDVVTIAFNNSEVVAHQIRLLRKNLKDPFHYTVADNSSDRTSSGEIERVCTEEAVPYIRLPRAPVFSHPSTSHGWALNWTVTNYLRPRSARYFGFLDHDVFPIRPTTVVQQLSKCPVWGHIQHRADRWYLWPGLCFFDATRIPAGRLDFMPGPDLDTGGRNFEAVYSALAERFEPPKDIFEHLRKGDDLQSDFYQVIGDWLHTLNASHWKPVPRRDHLVADLLNRF